MPDLFDHQRNETHLKILTIYDKSGPKLHRCYLPLYHMEGVEITVAQKLEESILEGIDIVFINRLALGCTIEQVEQWREKFGFKLIVDNDDHWNLDPHHILYDVYKERRIDEGIAEYMKIADAVTVTHDRLWVEAKRFNPQVYILPNALPKSGQFAVRKLESGFTRFFWCGGATHEKDIELLRHPLRRFNFPETMMVFGGHNDTPEYRRMVSAFTNGGKLRHQIIRGLPVDQYYQMYCLCDIALIPLVDTPFNRMKSNLKILEAANIGANVIVSKVHPYLDFPYVNYVENSSDWYKHAKRLLQNPEERKQQALRLSEYVDKVYNFEEINKERKQIFEYVSSKKIKNDLHAA